MPRATLSFFEIPAVDPGRLANFFRAVFGWEAVDVPWAGPRYVRLLPPESSERPGGGVLARDGSGLVESLTVMIRIEGETLEQALARIVAAGGRTALAPVAIGDSGRFARFTDPEGNSFGLWQPRPS
jgi:predicted enzyme related to lactoylglutathione lyase